MANAMNNDVGCAVTYRMLHSTPNNEPLYRRRIRCKTCDISHIYDDDTSISHNNNNKPPHYTLAVPLKETFNSLFFPATIRVRSVIHNPNLIFRSLRIYSYGSCDYVIFSSSFSLTATTVRIILFLLPAH